MLKEDYIIRKTKNEERFGENGGRTNAKSCRVGADAASFWGN